MKKFLISALVAVAFTANAQVELENKSDANKVETSTHNFGFTTVVDLEATPVKNQAKSSTCWSFAGISYIESEIIRQGGQPIDLSEMYVVRMVYLDKARKYIRMHGKTNFSPGGEAHDILYVLKQYGAMPQQAYSGLVNGATKYNHNDLDKVLREFIDVQIESKTVNPNWEKAFNSLMDLYLGELPESFTYEGKTYTPRTFADEVVKINPDDYVNLTSFTHHPFYSSFILEIPDNWIWASFYNVPLIDLMATLDNALNKGYTVGWATDISEKGFSRSNGLAIMPAKPIEDMTMEEKMAAFSGPHEEKIITQESRQEGFENYETQDDHGMHFTGILQDKNGAKYYVVKNSWGEKESPFKTGYVFASESYVASKTISILVHKDALPKQVQKELDL